MKSFLNPFLQSFLEVKVPLIIGSEGHGIDPEIKASCNTILKIQVNSDVMHLNAASAGAIFLHEASRSFNPIN